MSQAYRDKLRDPRWQKKRLRVMERDDFQCLCCGDNQATLNVHHKQYHGNPWDAPDADLETLCEPCHKDRTEVNRRFMRLDTGFVLDFVQEFMGWSPSECAEAILRHKASAS